MKRRLVVIVVVLLGVASTAAAQNKKADALFKQGKTALAEKKYAEACTAFEQSFKLDPTIGTQLNIGLCYEEWGKLATAYRAYRDAQKKAEETDDDRAPRIAERADAIERNVPRLTVRSSTSGPVPKDLVVKVDGDELTALGEPLLVDPGDHLVTYQAGDGPERKLTVKLAKGESKEAKLDLPLDMKGPIEVDLQDDKDKDKDIVVEDDTSSVGRGRRIAGFVVGGAGVLSIGISSYLVLDARSDYNSAIAAHCNEARECDDVGLDETHSARTRANVGTALFALGLAALGGGAYLYFTAPKGIDEHAVIPIVSPDGAGVAVIRSF
jgi:tetratricopeptide (TPR) repeat protein